MIQEGSSTGNSSSIQPTDMPFLQNLPFISENKPTFSVEDHTESLFNGNCVQMDINSFNQQEQTVLSDQTQGTVYFLVHQQLQQETLQQHENVKDQQFNSYTYGVENPLTPEGIPIGDNNMGDISDASTIEGEINANEENYAYLQGLNSDNLMQFSQQSALQEMVIEQCLGKTNHNVLPVFEEHDRGDYNFKVNIPTEREKDKRTWFYSEKFHKLFIKMNDILNIEVIYTPKMPIQQLRLRAFLCFVKDVCEPVRRCRNHLSDDNETNVIKRESLLRCENPDVEYSGTFDGKSIKERYSISVPLSMSVTKNDKTVKQAIALKFTCQNSCIKRRETRLMFLLEGMNGEILSQRYVNVRICSCPKRDIASAEKKRKTENDVFETDGRKRKRESISSDSLIIKDENSCSDYENAAKQYDLQRTPSGGFRLVMELSSKENALSTIKFAYANECENIVRGTKNEPRSRKCYERLKRLHDNNANFC